MSQDPQVVSISWVTTLSPDEVASKSFPAARRGVEGEAVRAFLSKVASELREALEREAVLRERLAEAERRAAEPVLDEATLTKAIGEETAKILSTAHEAARNVLASAEQQAAELTGAAERVLAERVAEAEAEALAIRSAAEQEAYEYAGRTQAEADALTDEAHSDVVELLDATKEECRRMVAEARDLRNRTLADLVARRHTLRVQLEELRVGKDSLLGVIDELDAAVAALRQRLVAAEDEARVAAEEAGERAEVQAGHELVELEAELAAGTTIGEGGPRAVEMAAGAIGAVVAGSEAVLEAGEAAEFGEGVAEAGVEAATSGGDTGSSGTSASRRSVDELFARIRASRAAEEAAASAAENAEAEAAVVAEAMAAAEARAAAELAGTADGPQAPGSPGTGEPPLSHGEGTVAPTLSDLVEATEGQGGGEGDATRTLGATADTEEHTEEIAAVVTVQDGADLSQEVPADQLGAVPGSDGAGALEPAEEELAADSEAVLEPAIEGGPDAVPVPPAKGRRRDVITEPDVESLARRDHLLAPVSAKLGRALKRALQDDQNDLLNALRKSSRSPVLDELIPPMAQRERFVAAASDQLAKAYEAGAAFLVTGDSVEGPSVSAPAPSAATAFEAGAAIAAQLADDLASMLRHRIEEALSELEGSAEGSADAAGVAYREWKGTRVEGLAGDFTTRAFAAGELAVLASAGNGAVPLVRWAVEDDDGGGSCPDCDDNSLAGPQVPGDAFPTGHAEPPVHPGCRCLLVPVRS